MDSVGSRKHVRSLGALATLALIVLALAACGGGGGGATTSATGKTFPLLKLAWGTTDYFDPGLSYRVESWQVFQDTYLGLVAKAPVSCETSDCSKIIPALAESLPTSNAAGTDYKFTLRSGLKYSNGETIKASDFKNTIIRDFKLNSPGISFYSNIVGVDACESDPTNCSNISGIVTDDSARTIEIQLQKPQSDFLYVLSIPFSAPVPSSTPDTDTEAPPPAASGPYYISQYSPSKSFTLLRNPHWKSIPGIPDGNPDKMVAAMSNDADKNAQAVVSGNADYDQQELPAGRLASLKAKYADRIRFHAGANTYYFFMNHSMAPFDNLKARQAVNYAVDRQALVKLRGGLGVATQNFLPPSYATYKKINPYPYNLKKAKKLVAESGTKGDHVDLYTIGDDAVAKASGEYLQGVLTTLGYDVTIHELSGDNYFTIIGDQSTKASIGFADWYEDYPYPTDWFFLLNGDTITEIHNNNYGLVNFPDVNAEIARLSALPPDEALSAKATADWAALDNKLQTKYAATVPYLNGILTSFYSSRMDVSCDVYTDNQVDPAQMCLK